MQKNTLIYSISLAALGLMALSATTALASHDGAQMPAPAGYTRLIFDDTFPGNKITPKKWIPQFADLNGVANCNGTCTDPLSGADPGGFDAEYFNPKAVVVANGLLNISAIRDTSQHGYSWQSGAISTHGLFYFKGGYVQIRAKMPDSSTGMWGRISLLEGGGEIDAYEGGYTGCGRSIINQCFASNLHASGNSQRFTPTGIDISADYHTYGLEYKPGEFIATYLDGKEMTRYTSTIPTGAYALLIGLQVAQNATGWHAMTSDLTQPQRMLISEVQVWQP